MIRLKIINNILNIAITITIFNNPKNYTFGFTPTKGSIVGFAANFNSKMENLTASYPFFNITSLLGSFSLGVGVAKHLSAIVVSLLSLLSTFACK